MVEPRGVEPRTSCEPCKRSFRLSYGPERDQVIPELVERAGLEPASPACKAGALPIELSSRAWGRFRAHLSAASTRRFHQISFPGELARTRRIELLSPEWRSGIEPINYIRMVRPRGFEPLVGQPACFTDAGFTDRWQERDAYVVPSLELVLARRSPRESKVAEGEGVEPSTARSARFSGPVACHHAPPSVTVSVIRSQ